MLEESAYLEDYEKLSEFIVNCPELAELESLLGGFNIFQVLGFEYGEIRHSNVLAWLLDPSESHGLDDSFLQGWLKRVLHDAPIDVPITPIHVHCWSLRDVEVRREWQHIDLLLILTMIDGAKWVVAVENKVKSQQHSNQLTRYRRMVNRHFADAQQRLFLFLTKNGEEPADDAYIPATYSQVYQSLKESVGARGHLIGSEPLVLINNYLRLIEEKFMNESDIAILAQKIYKQHKRALEIIFAQRPDNIKEVAGRIEALMVEEGKSRGFSQLRSDRQNIRFLPEQWNHPGNSHGKAIRGVPHGVFLEICLLDEKVSLQVCAYKNPEVWSERIWEISSHPPFENPRQGRKKLKHNWLQLHERKLDVEVDWDDVIDADEVAAEIVQEAMKVIASPEFQQILHRIAEELPLLEESHQTRE